MLGQFIVFPSDVYLSSVQFFMITNNAAISICASMSLQELLWGQASPLVNSNEELSFAIPW